ncbi:MAG: SRPBCC family protein [Solirubrobacteraceae bacterium]|nr:SRPBCC family protein [Solirubrobacteraceae bacterium]
MGSISTVVDIAAPVDQVWDVIVDPSTYDRWMTVHTKWKSEIPAQYEVGTQTEEVVTMLGMANTISWTVEELEAPSKLTISGTGMAGVRTTFAFGVASDGDGGSRATIVAEFEGQMIVGALAQAIEQDAKKNLEESLAKLAEVAAA